MQVVSNPFDVSLLSNYPQNVITFTFAAYYQSMLLASQFCVPVFKPLNCPFKNSTLCAEILCPGLNTAPGVVSYFENLNQSVSELEWDTSELAGLEGITIDFWSTVATENTLEGVSTDNFECGVYGTQEAAFQFCLGDSQYLVDHQVAGILAFLDCSDRQFSMSALQTRPNVSQTTLGTISIL